jgi:hypothetical protein
MISKHSKLIESFALHEDDRGSILTMINENVKNVAIINSKKGSLRGNHYHKKDWHYMMALKGYMEYFYFSNSEKKIKYLKVLQNQILFTPNLEVHATFFPEDSQIIVLSGLPRDQETYESDVIRVDFINKDKLDDARNGIGNCQFLIK